MKVEGGREREREGVLCCVNTAQESGTAGVKMGMVCAVFPTDWKAICGGGGGGGLCLATQFFFI